MSELFPVAPADAAPEPEPTAWQDRRLDREEARSRWRVRAAQWRALELARALFGEETTARLALGDPARAFRGLLYLEVPFRDLDDHRFREAVFLACAGRDPVMAGTPFIFIFEPRPAGRPA